MQNKNIIEELSDYKLDFNYSKQNLKLRTSKSLFSAPHIDSGTLQLLNSLRKNKEISYDKCLDLGCGYGSIGLFLKSNNPQAKITLSDRDLLACRFSAYNAAINSLDVKITESIFFESIKEKFSLICCNYPAKLNEEGLTFLLSQSALHLEEMGTLAIVVVKTLKSFLLNYLKNIEIIPSFQSSSKNYFLLHFRKKDLKKIKSKKWFDSIKTFSFEEKDLALRSSIGLGEFDTISYGTLTAFELSKNLDLSCSLFYQPMQGAIACGLSNNLKKSKTTLCSRDSLSLKMSLRNTKNYDIDAKINAEAWLTKNINYNYLFYRVEHINNTSLDIYNLKNANTKNLILFGKSKLVNSLIKNFSFKVNKKIIFKNYIATLISKFH